MLLSKRFFYSRALQLGLICTVLAVSACGYQPLYGKSTLSNQSVAQLAEIYVAPIEDRAGQKFRSALTHRLSPTAQPGRRLFTLDVTLEESISTLAVERDASATRGNLTLTATYTLVKVADGKTMTSGSVTTISSYNILKSDFATLSAEKNSRTRAIENLADALRTRLAIYFQSLGSSALNQSSGAQNTLQTR